MFQDVFLVCFSVDTTSSFEKVEYKWIPEVEQYCPGTPIILVGTRADLREDHEEIEFVNEESVVI